MATQYENIVKIGDKYFQLSEDSRFGGRMALTYLPDANIKALGIDPSQVKTINSSSIKTTQNEGLSSKLGQPITTIDSLGGYGEIIIPNTETGKYAGLSDAQLQGVQTGGGLYSSQELVKFETDTGYKYDANTGVFTDKTGKAVPTLEQQKAKQMLAAQTGIQAGANNLVGGPTTTLSTTTQPITSAQQTGTVSRQGDDFYLDGRKIDQAEFQKLGINEKFVQSGQTVPLSFAVTGNNNSNSSSNTSSTTNNISNSGVTLTNEQMRANLSSILPANMIGMIPDSQLAAFSAISDSFKQQYSQGVVNSDINAGDLQKAIDSVANDVEFQAKYGDQLKLSTANFQNNLQNIQFETQQVGQQQAQQFTDQQKALAEEKAAMGQAYSGFRQQAKDRLHSDQTGIIESTRQQLKNNLTNLGQGWEEMYGTKGAQTPSVGYVNPLTGQMDKQAYNPIGGVFGSVPLAKKQEQESLGAQRYEAVKLPI